MTHMTKEINSIDFLRDYREGKSYEKIAISQGCSITTVANRVRDLGLKRDRKGRELFSAEEKKIMRGLIGTYRGRKQLLEILRGN